MMSVKELLGEELFGQVEAALRGKGKDGRDILLAVANDGSYLPKAKLDEALTEVKSLREQIGRRDEEIAALQASGGEKEELERALAEWKETYERDTGKLSADIEQMRFDSALDLALTGAKAKNAKAVRALLDMEKISWQEGELQGLNEQLTELKGQQSFLFEGEESGFYRPAAGGHAPDFSRMSDGEYYRYTQKKG